MGTRPLICLLIALVLAFCAVPAAAQQAPPVPGQKPAKARPSYTPHKETKEEVTRLTQEAEEKARDFATFANERLEKATDSRVIGWGAVVASVIAGGLSLFFGWLLIQTLLVPSAPVVGLITGAVLAFSIVESSYTQASPFVRLALVALGGALALGAYLFSALRAKPIATFLVIMSPFLIIAALLFSYSEVLGFVLFAGGFVAGFLAMMNVRPLSVFASSVFGASALLGAFGMMAHVMEGNDAPLQQAWDWLVEGPMMLLIAWVVIAFVGMSFQFATGPRGSLQG
jgi:MFS family permease